MLVYLQRCLHVFSVIKEKKGPKQNDDRISFRDIEIEAITTECVHYSLPPMGCVSSSVDPNAAYMRPITAPPGSLDLAG